MLFVLLKILYIHITWVIFQQLILRDMKPVVFIVRIQSPFSKSAKLRACVLKTCSLANVSSVPTYSRVSVTCVLTCWRANVPCMLTCSCANMPCVFTCWHANVSCLSTCSCLPCFACSRASVPCVLCVSTCSRATTTNNKDKFSITCFPYIFVIVFCLFPVK